MHSALSRLNAVGAYSTSVLAAVMALAFATSLFTNPQPVAELALSKISVHAGREYPNSPVVDVADFTFDLSGDFGEAFSWNTKQLFLYLVAEYPTDSHAVNQIVVWDYIMPRGSSFVLNLKNQRIKYGLVDDGHGLVGNKNVRFILAWNLIPYSGTLPRLEAGRRRVQFPGEYGGRHA